MKYEEVRIRIRSGDLLAWSHRTPWYRSWHDFKIAMVRMFTMSEFSHVGVAWRVGGRVMVIEAVQPSVRIIPLSKTGEFYWVPVPAQFTDDVLEFALSKVGEPYSQLQAMEALFRLPSDDNKWECAELSRSILARAGVDLGDVATPTAVVHKAMEGGALVRIVN